MLHKFARLTDLCLAFYYETFANSVDPDEPIWDQCVCNCFFCSTNLGEARLSILARTKDTSTVLIRPN